MFKIMKCKFNVTHASEKTELFIAKLVIEQFIKNRFKFERSLNDI